MSKGMHRGKRLLLPFSRVAVQLLLGVFWAKNKTKKKIGFHFFFFAVFV
jgi:hypothetical protein